MAVVAPVEPNPPKLGCVEAGAAPKAPTVAVAGCAVPPNENVIARFCSISLQINGFTRFMKREIIVAKGKAFLNQNIL